MKTILISLIFINSLNVFAQVKIWDDAGKSKKNERHYVHTRSCTK